MSDCADVCVFRILDRLLHLSDNPAVTFNQTITLYGNFVDFYFLADYVDGPFGVCFQFLCFFLLLSLVFAHFFLLRSMASTKAL
jgi:hypothetical protein